MNKERKKKVIERGGRETGGGGESERERERERERTILIFQAKQ